MVLQALFMFLTNTPYLAHWRVRQHRMELVFVGAIDSFIGPGFFCITVGHFCQGLGRTNANADGDAGATQHRFADFLCQQSGVLVPQGRKIGKDLVDALNLGAGYKFFDHLHHARTHVAIKRIVG